METSNQFENIFEKGCLVQLSISVWGGAKKIDEEKAKEALGSEWAKARKNLVDPEALKPVCKVRNEARIFVRGCSLPFPIKGVSFVPFGSVPKMDERLGKMQEGFEEACRAFYRTFPQLRERAKEVLGELYCDGDYPSDIERYFGFEWRFITMNAPGENNFLSPELVKREREKFINTMEEARELGVSALREEFAGILRNCVERLQSKEDGSRKIFRDSLVGNFFEFFETFKERNIFKDGELEVLCQQAQGILQGVDAEKLRDNEGLREVVRESMRGLGVALDQAIVAAPKRKLRLDD